MMAFHRRSKRVKTFSETFVTMYLYKRDSNTSKRTFIKTRKKTRKKKTLFKLVKNLSSYEKEKVIKTIPVLQRLPNLSTLTYESMKFV